MSTKSLEEIKSVMANAICLHDQAAVEAAYDKLALQISEHLIDRNPILLAVMTGGMIPATMLAMRLNFPMEIDYLHATCYKGETRPTDLHWRVEPKKDLTNRTVLIVDDILDRGVTLAAVIEYCKIRGAKEIFTAVLVDKAHERDPKGLKQADFTGLYIEDKYVFGCGLDYHDYLRNVPGIYAVHLNR